MQSFARKLAGTEQKGAQKQKKEKIQKKLDKLAGANYNICG
jgi:hypothetical protein